MKMLDVILPVFVILAIGIVFGLKNKERNLSVINNYVLYVALPALFLKALATNQYLRLLEWDFFMTSLAGIGVSFILGFFLSKKRYGHTLEQANIMGMASSYGTTGYMGLPILMLMYSEKAIVPASISTILHNIPVILAVTIMFESGRALKINEGNNLYASISKSVAKILFANPLILSIIFGMLINLYEVRLPVFVFKTIDALASSAAPVALFTLGLSISQLNLSLFKRAALGKIFPIIIIKNFFHPLITFFLILFFSAHNLGNLWNVTSIVMAVQPIGAGVLIFSNRYHCLEEEISLAIVISMGLSVLTLPVTLNLLV